MNKVFFTLLFGCANLYYPGAKQIAGLVCITYPDQNAFALINKNCFLTQSSCVWDSGLGESWKNTFWHDTLISSNESYQAARTEKILRKTEDMRKAAEMSVGEFLKKRYCIDNNLISSYSEAETSLYQERFGPKIKELGKLTEKLNDLVKAGPQKKNPEALTTYQNQLTSLVKTIDTGFNQICEAQETLCGCYSG
ncbi:MAG: hypothetical protein COW65_06505 [Cytophagales bacterium CG18_big_fil_WC_8_21_14_2_50_42_9]|nr:MAG: hypothetical protein COW65_06505 [Cytophagales bacterium CG18_big_fil_WC_8_21_14_2_50_42_9]